MSDVNYFQFNNVLSNKQRKLLIKTCKPLVRKLSPSHPALQTNAYALFQNKDISFFYDILGNIIRENLNLNFKFTESWFNEDSGLKKDICWHTHPEPHYTCVYYAQTIPFFSSGTLFKEKFVRSKQNSLLIFPGSILHGTPSYPFHLIKRYTLVTDMIFG